MTSEGDPGRKVTHLPSAGPEEMAKSMDKPRVSRRRSVNMGVTPQDFRAILGPQPISDTKVFEGVTDASAGHILKEQVMDVFASLSPTERQVKKLLHGLTGDRARTYEEAAVELGMTAEQVQEIDERGNQKLVHPERSPNLRDFLDASDDSPHNIR